MVDYARTSANAQRLITKFGRTVTFVKYSETPSDPSQPWDEPSGAASTVDLSVVMVSPSLQRILGKGIDLSNLVDMSDEILIVAQGSVDLKQYSEVIDNTETFGITDIQILKPGDTELLAFVGVKR